MRRGASGGGLAEPRLEDVLDHQQRGNGPQGELEGSEDGVGTGSGADGSTAEEKLAEEDGEGDEAGEVEQNVQELERNGAPGMRSCRTR